MHAGPVELWLGEVERRMKSSVRAQTQASLVDYTTRPRPDWVRKWPAMAVLAVSAICWSQVKCVTKCTVSQQVSRSTSKQRTCFLPRLTLHTASCTQLISCEAASTAVCSAQPCFGLVSSSKSQRHSAGTTAVMALFLPSEAGCWLRQDSSAPLVMRQLSASCIMASWPCMYKGCANPANAGCSDHVCICICCSLRYVLHCTDGRRGHPGKQCPSCAGQMCQ